MYARYDYQPVTEGPADAVYGQLLDDYDAEDIGWVLAAQWTGPVMVDMSEIDFSNQGNWIATDDPEKVDEFASMIEEGEQKPIILVQQPSYQPLVVIDGHHRLLAYQKLEKPALAYVARVGACYGPWSDMHSSQRTGPSIKT